MKKSLLYVILILMMTFVLSGCGDKNKETKVETEVETKVESKTETEVETKSESKVETEVETKSESKVETEVETKSESKTETEKETQVETQTSVESEKENNLENFTVAKPKKITDEDIKLLDKKIIDLNLAFLPVYEGDNGNAKLVGMQSNVDYSLEVLNKIAGSKDLAKVQEKLKNAKSDDQTLIDYSYIGSMSVVPDESFSNLKNGDKIKLKVQSDESLKSKTQWKLSGDEVEFTVEGLK